MLGPSTVEDGGGARILAAFDPCVLSDGKVLLNLPDEQGIQLVASQYTGWTNNTVSFNTIAENSSRNSGTSTFRRRPERAGYWP